MRKHLCEQQQSMLLYDQEVSNKDVTILQHHHSGEQKLSMLLYDQEVSNKDITILQHHLSAARYRYSPSTPDCNFVTNVRTCKNKISVLVFFIFTNVCIVPDGCAGQAAYSELCIQNVGLQSRRSSLSAQMTTTNRHFVTICALVHTHTPAPDGRTSGP
jgi:hypothetical protein